ncbi:MAG: hypothetical protein KDA60_06100, partial [Planctomycetales bacterium]|nr:hypothetical protein [Planctomycetales bacterium]
NSRPHARAVSPEDQATMLVGAYVPAWTHHEVTEQVPAEKFDDTVERIASAAGLDVSRPFIFTIEGEFTDVRLHVINGTCPIHARMKKTELSEQSRPFEDELPKVSGKVVGVFAKDAVGNLTHPATSTHIHLLYTDLATGKMITGHLEQIGLQKGVTLSLPQK